MVSYEQAVKKARKSSATFSQSHFEFIFLVIIPTSFLKEKFKTVGPNNLPSLTSWLKALSQQLLKMQ